MIVRLDFQPLPFIKGGHAQTLLGSCINFEIAPVSETCFVDLADGEIKQHFFCKI